MTNPIQPLLLDDHGTVRFKPNAIVQYLLDSHPACDLNTLAKMNFTDDDRQQFAQLIGYSLSGYCDLSYVSDAAYSAAGRMVAGMGESDASTWKRDDDSTYCLLLLCGGHDVPREAVTAWTDEQCQQAEEWAGREHLHASDNDDLERVPMPPHVAAHPPKRLSGGDVGTLWD